MELYEYDIRGTNLMLKVSIITWDYYGHDNKPSYSLNGLKFLEWLDYY
jgi:hypothetical protein